MPLSAVNFVTKGPVMHADLLQFYNLFTGVMTDQPITFPNVVSIGGSQGNTTVPLKLYGAAGQTTHLFDLYADHSASQPGWGMAALGQMGWGPGGAASIDTTLSRVATQNGHASDTAGILITPYLEVAGNIQAVTYVYTNGATVTGPGANPLQLTINQDLLVNRNVYVGDTSHILHGPVNATTSLSIECSTGYSFLCGSSGTQITYNGYWDGTNWMRFNTSNTFFVWYLDASGATLSYAAAAANPISGQTNLLRVDAVGNLTAGGNVFTVQGAGQGSATWIMSGGNLLNRMDGSWYFQNAAGSANRMTLDNGGNLILGGFCQVGNTLVFSVNGYYWAGIAGVAAVRTNGSIQVDGGAVYFEASRAVMIQWRSDLGALYIPYGNGIYTSVGTFTGQVTISSYCRVANGLATDNGNLYFRNDNAIYISWDGGSLRTSHNILNMGALYYFSGNGGIWMGNWDGSSIHTSHPLFVGGAPGTGITYSGGGANQSITCSGAVLSASWQFNAPGGYTQNSSEKIKTNIVTIPESKWHSLLRDDSLRGLHYQRTDVPDIAGERWEYGFSADRWLARVPEVVTTDADGEPESMYYNGVVPFLWEAVRCLLARVESLEAQEQAA